MSEAAVTPDERVRRIRRVLAVILVANWAVASLKVAIGLWGDLASVTADGLHSFIDGGSNVLGLVAMAVAARPADEDHPYGHNKFEAIASLGIGAMVGIGMLELGRMAYHALVSDVHPRVEPVMMVVLAITVGVNVFITRVERHWGHKLRSPLLLADARHTLSDVFISLAVLGSMVLVYLGLPKADGLVAIFVLFFVAKVAWDIVRQAVGVLSDTAQLDPVQVSAEATGVQGVLRAQDVRSRGMDESIWVDLKIGVAPQTTTAHAHELAHEVERRILARWPQVVDVVVHVEPDTGPQA